MYMYRGKKKGVGRRREEGKDEDKNDKSILTYQSGHVPDTFNNHGSTHSG